MLLMILIYTTYPLTVISQHAYRMNGFKLYVTNTSSIPPEGYLCYEDGPGQPSITQTIPCNQPGKYVNYYDNTGDYQFGQIIELCYVAITDNQESPSGPGLAIGGGIIGVIIVVILVVLAVIIYRRRSASPQDKYLGNSESLSQSERNTYYNHEIIQNKEEGYTNMGSKISIEDVHVSVTDQHTSNRRDSEENDQLPEENEYEEEDERDLYTNEVSRQTKYKIPISDLKNVIKEKRKDEGFNNECKILPKGPLHANNEGSKEENKLKNRFLRTWPYDQSRIVLTGNTKHDYINASNIDSYDKTTAYIASQGPKKKNLRDFWDMIWQENVGKIVMVTKQEKERRVRKSRIKSRR